MGNTMSSGEQRLVIECEEGGMGFIAIDSTTTTLLQVRDKIMTEFDSDMLPSGAWYFLVDGIRIAQSQESTVLACGLCSGGSTVRLQSKKRQVTTAADSASNKKARLTTDQVSSVFESPLQNEVTLGSVSISPDLSENHEASSINGSSNPACLRNNVAMGEDRSKVSHESEKTGLQPGFETPQEKDGILASTRISPSLSDIHEVSNINGSKENTNPTCLKDSVAMGDEESKVSQESDKQVSEKAQVQPGPQENEGTLASVSISPPLSDIHEVSNINDSNNMSENSGLTCVQDNVDEESKVSRESDKQVPAKTEVQPGLEEYQVSIFPDPKCGLGIGLRGQANGMPAVVEAVFENRVSLKGKVTLGDELLSADGIPLTDKSFKSIVKTIRRVTDNAGPNHAVLMKFRRTGGTKSQEESLPRSSGGNHNQDSVVDSEQQNQGDAGFGETGSERQSRGNTDALFPEDSEHHEEELDEPEESAGDPVNDAEGKSPDRTAVLASTDRLFAHLQGTDSPPACSGDIIKELLVEYNCDRFSSSVSAAVHRRVGELILEAACNIESATDQNSRAAAKDDSMIVEGTQTGAQSKDVLQEGGEDVVAIDMSDKINCTNETHRKHDLAIEKSCSVLQKIKTALEQNPMFCSEDRRTEFSTEIAELLSNTDPPQTTIGVLGNTGVGKSSLLNALLDEASILPTSGSRGCTACVVELRYNSALKGHHGSDRDVAVYRGQIEFMTLDEWSKELRVLLEECSTHEDKKIYARTPDAERQPDAAAAWSKVNQVYGRGTMEKCHGHHLSNVYQSLSQNNRVRMLLLPDNGNNALCNSIFVEEGSVQADEAEKLLSGLDGMGRKLQSSLKRWGKSFRRKINDYVYRKGNGNEPQTWPLIRKVVLNGPWPILSTGACLVDLPGVRDANAARAKVAEQYLQNCSQIWIAAPIKRAVDDGTAKELLGENFKRRLLMDGQYGNVSFICTQTDDCEATETMTDHQDVAERLACWDDMEDLHDKLCDIEGELSELTYEGEILHHAHENAKDALEEVEFASDDNCDGEGLLDIKKDTVELSREKLHSCKQRILKLKSRSQKLQRKLKALCAIVRNEYSKRCLQEDFHAGLKELTLRADRDDGDADNKVEVGPVPDDFEMDVFCISANDYLKIRGIKPASDGPPNAFTKVRDTQIPALRDYVHDTTATYRSTFSERFVETTSNILDRVKLVASDAKGVASGRKTRRFQAAFESSMHGLDDEVPKIVEDFRKKAVATIASSLKPALVAGAAKGKNAALETVASWASKSKRSKHDRGPERNGLHYMSYKATIRRDGVYVSKSAGPIDMNQELCDPVEKEFSTDWQRIMDGSIKVFLDNAERQLLGLGKRVGTTLATALAEAGVETARLHSLQTAANRSCTTSIVNAFVAMKATTSNCQRELNRSLLPKIQERMGDSYNAALRQPGGSGVFVRMNGAMQHSSNVIVDSMFIESTQELSKAVEKLIMSLATRISATSDIIMKSMENVFSILWEDQGSQNGFVDPAKLQMIRQCRDKLLPLLQDVAAVQGEAQCILGIEREDLELDVVGVDCLEDRLAKKFGEAEDRGMVIDLCMSDDDDDNDWELDRKFAAKAEAKVKAEPSRP